jgi:hypothetical protein
MGKIGYATPMIARPRLAPSSASHSADLRAVQACINDMARSITGLCRKDHIHVHDLLDRAGLLSLNALSVKATATVAWRAYHSDDGGYGQRNPLGLLLFGPRLGECHTINKDRNLTASWTTHYAAKTHWSPMQPLSGTHPDLSEKQRLHQQPPRLPLCSSKSFRDNVSIYIYIYIYI